MKFPLVGSLLQIICVTIGKATALFFLLVSLLISEPAFSQGSSEEFRTVHVKFKPKFKPNVSIAGQSARSGMTELDKVSEKYRALSIRRIFPEAGKFEAAHRAYGLHLWYEIEFRKDARLDEAMAEYRNLNYFSNVEECKEYTAGWETEGNSSLTILPPATNDPLFSDQWHFHNTGQTGGTPGADINLLKAWETERGKPNVIVAVIDGGVNLYHPDLAGALWRNEDEIPDNRIDDDNNGYIDDVHGYGFGDKSSTIFPNDHGTHVAGTIGAVSGNGIGVSGIAGGTGSGDGVRIMSCATFGNFDKGGFEAAMVYAADNGAVISQNSWGGGSTAIEAAIDYFVNRAGYDNSDANFLSNIQTGPMAGGLVIFAAGNLNTDNPKKGYPASYVSAIAVASADHNDVKSDFSNYGTWVDISAPGTSVYSTIDSGYGVMSGTSMACPHVSGVAALVVSHIQRPGLYPRDVWNRLRLSARSFSGQSPAMSGLLGSGHLDAFAALQEPDAIPPSAIIDLEATEIRYSSVVLEWTATGASENVGQAARYEIRYSSTPINQSNFSGATLVLNPPIPPIAGARVRFEASAPHSTSLYFAVKGIDLFNNASEISNMIHVVTPDPPKPEYVTTELTEQLYTGGISSRGILVKNIGQDELMIRLGVPDITPAPMGLPAGIPGRLFGINTSRNTIEELNPETGSVIGFVPMPETSTNSKEGLAFDGRNLFYGNSDKIYKLNAKTGEVLRSFALFSLEIHGLAWSGRYLYASVKVPGYWDKGWYRIYEVDADNGNAVREFNHAVGELTFAGKRGSLFAIKGSYLVELSIATGELIHEIFVGGTPAGVGYSESENLIFVSDGSSIKAIHPDTGELLYTLPNRSTTALASDEHTPGWLTAEDTVVTISPGATSDIPVTFNATGLPSGEWTGTIKVIPMNGFSDQRDIPLKLTVTAAPDIETVRQINFGTQYLGYSIDSVVSVENVGTSDLIIHDIQSNDSRVIASVPSLTLAPGQRVPVMVTVVAIGTGPIDALLTFSSNDPDEDVLSIPVQAVVLQPPAVEVSPASLSTTLPADESRTLNFTAKNTGGSVLHWNVNFAGSGESGLSQSTAEQGPLSQTSGVAHQSGLGEFALHAPSPERVTCLSYDHQSGFLYARSLVGSTFYRYDPVADNWTAIGVAPSAFTGQAAYLDGRIYHPGGQLNVYTIQTNSWTSVPFPIPEETGNLTSDGQYIYVVFGASLYRYDPVSKVWLPLAPAPRNLGPYGGLSYKSGVIYAHEDATTGFYGDGNTNFYKYYLASNTWITVGSIPGKASSGSAIDPAGRRYFSVGAPYGRQGVGVQMSVLDLRTGEWLKIETPFEVTSHSGLVYVGRPGYSGIYLIQGGGTQFARYATDPAAEWISITPSAGDLAPGATQTFAVDVNAAGLDGGTYSGNLRVYSNHPAIEKNVPLSVTVIGVPDISINSTTADVGDVIIGKQRGATLNVKNTGTAPLVISSIISNHPEFISTVSPFTLQTGEAIDLAILFVPTTTGLKTGTITLISNDPDEGNIQFSVKGNGVNPPIPGITHSLVSANLLTGAKSVQEITISNTGGITMEYAVDFLPAGDWLKGYTYGYLAPGQSKTIEVTFDAGGKPAGVYTGVLRYYVHAIDYWTEIPVSMTVTGASDILTSKNSLDFGSQFLNYQYDSILEIKNDGVFPLSITTVKSDNASFTVSAAAPLNLAPGERVNATIRFNPTTLGIQSGQLTLVSDDPDEGTLIIPLSGAGIANPVVASSVTEMVAYAQTGEMQTLPLVLSNTGGSVLKWHTKDHSIAQPSPTDEGARTTEPLSAGEFTSMRSTPGKLTAPAVNPSTGLIYALAPYGQNLYAYDFATGNWTPMGQTPVINSEHGGAVFLNSKMYSVYPEYASTIFVYNLTLADWTSIPNGLGAATGTITTDGTLLYLAGGGNFKSLNPKSGIWTDLPLPTITLDGAGGLSCYNGIIYAHEGNGNGFAKYTIATGIWETLIPVPDQAQLGSVIDPIKERYYAYGKNADGYNFLYEYDFTANLWTVIPFDTFELSEGGMVHTTFKDFEGIYILQGKSGNGFVRYEPKEDLPWLRSIPLTGEILPSGSRTIGVNFNAYGLNTGTYKGTVFVTSNDPTQRSLEIPVTFLVTNPGPAIEVPAEITATLERSTPYTTQLKIENKGPGVLQWNFADTLPIWLDVSKSSGELSGYSSETIDVTFDARLFPTDVLDFSLEISSNDLFNPTVATTLSYSIITNYAPFVANTIPTQWIEFGSTHLSLVGVFSDPNNDPLSFSATSSNVEVALVDVTGTSLSIYPGKPGTAVVSVKATDVFNESATTTFNTVVYDFITGVEHVAAQDLSAIPNPFDKEVTISYHTDAPGVAEVFVLDISGRVVWQASEVEEVQGVNEIKIKGHQLVPGVYNCRLIRDGKAISIIRIVRY